MTAIATLASVPAILGAAPEAPVVSFATFIGPFLPAIIAFCVAVALEAVLLWTERTPEMNWWFGLAFVTIGVFLLIWDSWSRGVPMAALADAPDQEGLRFRARLIGFGLAVVGSVLYMAVAGIRMVMAGLVTTGPFVMAARLLPGVVVPVLLAWHVRVALRVFEGISFRLFI